MSLLFVRKYRVDIYPGSYGYNTIQSTRRVFAYGLVFMIPALFVFGFDVELQQFSDPTNIFNILYLGAGASALCFVTWNVAVKILGAVKTSIYIYMVPVITVVTSVIILGEKITLISGTGTILTLLGLIISEYKGKKYRERSLLNHTYDVSIAEATEAVAA